MRHVGAHAAYHDDNARMGIPEPVRLDPECGAAALASILRSLSMPYDHKTVVASMHITGRGSSTDDIMNAAKKLGLTPHSVTADDQGLIMLPKPLVAYVECIFHRKMITDSISK
jgi:ABC-type bacteriocin/lantibiotic exporter with double-glycine peptidase domain